MRLCHKIFTVAAGWGVTMCKYLIMFQVSLLYLSIYFSGMADMVERNKVKDATGGNHTKRENGTGRKGVLVCHIFRDPAAFCLGFLSFLSLLLLRTLQYTRR